VRDLIASAHESAHGQRAFWCTGVTSISKAKAKEPNNSMQLLFAAKALGQPFAMHRASRAISKTTALVAALAVPYIELLLS
jgi:hypothetical protein